MALGVEGVRVGVWTDAEHHTGCTVILPPAGAIGGMAVRGGAPGTREAAILGPATPNEACHAVVLCGSSLFGLRAADGVVDWCEARGIGLDLGVARFPIVGAAVVLDIHRPDMRRIDREAGRAACEAATADPPPNGSVGVGAGCTVGKEAGLEWASKGGQGIAVRRSGDVTVGALVAVNALGSVVGEDGRIIAGCRAPPDLPRYPYASMSVPRATKDRDAGDSVGGDANTDAGYRATRGAGDAAGGRGSRAPDGRAGGAGRSDADGSVNGDSGGDGGDGSRSVSSTVIGCIVTNARLGKPAVCRVADLGHTGIARAVSPAHTSLDGDALFALATGEIEARVDLVAELAAQVVAEAVREGVRHAEGIPGFPADPRARSAGGAGPRSQP